MRFIAKLVNPRLVGGNSSIKKKKKKRISGCEFDVRSSLLIPISQDSGVDFVENGL